MGETKPATGVISYRISLMIAIPALVLITGALLAWHTYLSTRESISGLAQTLFGQVADQTASQVRTHVSEAAPAVDLLTSLLSDDTAPTTSDDSVRRLLRVLVANPGFEWVTYSQPDGTFIGATRRAGAVIVNRGHVIDGKSIIDEYTVDPDGSWKLARHSDDYTLDPRTRPYYKLAVAEKKRVWVGPYIFFDEGVPGVTCAEPVYGRDGALRGVVTIDFDLNILSTFVGTLHPSPHARVFVYTSQGEILAHPTLRATVHRNGSDEGTLVTAADVTDGATRIYFAELAKHGALAQAAAPTEVIAGGMRFYASTRSFDASDGLPWKVGAIAPESDFLGDLDRTTRNSLLVSLAAVVLAITLAGVLARTVATPLANLAREMERIGGFQLDGADPSPSFFTEIEVMNRGLVGMKGSLRSFASYVPRDLVRAVLASGEEAVLGGKTKPMTVFFSDLAGFTSFSETMSPDELVALLGDYFDAMTKVIGARGGTIDKFIGDAIMAFWNAPTSEERHAALACEAALACVRKLEDMKRESPVYAVLSARIGIATGAALVGNIGSRERMNYTVMGDTANLASRLEGLGKQYGTSILVSEATYHAAKGAIVMRAVDMVAVKGKSQAVRIFEPLALRSETKSESLEREAASLEALDAYLGQRFGDAARAWERMLTLAPGDKAAQLMLDRAAAYAVTPPAPGWDGVWVITEK